MNKIKYPSVLYDLDEKEYHASDQLNKSSMVTLWDKSAWHFKCMKEISIPPTPAMIRGTAVHLRLLEPLKYMQTITVHKLKAPKFIDGMIFLHEDTLAEIEKIAEQAKNWPLLNNFIENSKHEVSIFWEDKLGINCKARLDMVDVEYGIIGDLKTCRSADYKTFRKASEDHKYHWQHVFYCDGAQAVFNKLFDFVFFVIEGDPVPSIACYRMTREAIDKAVAELDYVKREYKQCLEKNIWPSYSTKIQDLELRPWA